MIERHKVVPAVYLIMRQGDKILLMLRQNTGYYDGWYSVPSGHVEASELPIDALLRETKEEIGVDLDRATIKHIHTMYRTASDAAGDRADYFFETTSWQGEPSNTEPNKCVRLGWFSLNALPENLTHHQRYAFDAIKNHSTYSEISADRVIKNPTQ